MNVASLTRLLLLLVQCRVSVGTLLTSCCYAIVNNKTHEFLVPSDCVDQGEQDSRYVVASQSSGFASTWKLSLRPVSGDQLVTFQNLRTKQFLFTGAHNLLYTADMPNSASSTYLLPKGVQGGLISQRNAFGGYTEYVRAEKYPGFGHAFVKQGKLIERSYWTFIHRPCVC
uniref:Uncharacterized protein n=1 Tax=Anopheles farauti TaxID=69004 RepID=A0A182QMP8_9DIPT